MRGRVSRAAGGTGRAALGVLFFCACDFAPRYVRPSAPVPAEFKEDSAAAYRALPAGTWKPAHPQDATLKGRWWTVFEEPELEALEQELDINNQTIAQYFENFMAARAQVNEARAGYFPTLALSPTVNVGNGNSGTAGTNTGTTAANAGVGASGAGAAVTESGIFHFFSVPLEASWAPDLWGRVRNTVRQARYAAQVSAADLENERLTEQATLAEYYFELRGQDALSDLYTGTVTADAKSLELTRAQFTTGVGAEVAVAQAEVTLQNARASGIGIALQRAVYEHAIATLIGKPASSFSLPVRPLSTPVPVIPVGVPSQLLERRPDVAAAERTLAQANALIGVEKAAFFPSLDLSASGGVASSTFTKLFSLPSLFWSLGASASETLFDGGLRSATIKQYEALYRADVAAYRQTVLTAFQQVEDAIATLRVLSQQITAQEQAVSAAKRYLDIAVAQYQTGLQPYLNVTSAQTVLLGDQQTLVTLRVSQMTAAVQLIQALGGGWDLSQLPTESEVTSKKAVRKVSAP